MTDETLYLEPLAFEKFASGLIAGSAHNGAIQKVDVESTLRGLKEMRETAASEMQRHGEDSLAGRVWRSRSRTLLDAQALILRGRG